jgi:putative IMPACT (imprinted ancient) family translation regulator
VPAPSAQALSHIAGASDPTASHNCWAFKVAGSARSNDDGEPGGTGVCALVRVCVCVFVVRGVGRGVCTSNTAVCTGCR